jgi:hypothetical protein
VLASPIAASAANACTYVGIGLAPSVYLVGALLAASGFAVTMWNVVTVTWGCGALTPDGGAVAHAPQGTRDPGGTRPRDGAAQAPDWPQSVAKPKVSCNPVSASAR